MNWQGHDSEVGRAVADQNARVLETYRADSARVRQDANIERSIVEGAYAKRQLFELLQNAADASRGTNGRCEVVLTDATLYVANNGDPVSTAGVRALMATHDSVKRDEQIGRFGLGFKSLLAVSDAPKVLSRSGSFSFDKALAAEVFGAEVAGLTHYPIMRWAQPIDPFDLSRGDVTLEGMMKWAATVIVVPVARDHDILASSVREFPAEFLLFSQHVKRLELTDQVAGTKRTVTLESGEGAALRLVENKRTSTWVLSQEVHTPSAEALADGGYSAARERIELSWAAPLDGAPKGIGRFWAYFPTLSTTTLSGIVNAPWKLADDRESLLEGTFNTEILTEVLPRLVAKALPRIHEAGKPAAVLDALPARGREARNFADGALNEPIMRAASNVQCIPTLAGGLRHPTRVHLHPDGLEDAELAIWAAACRDPENWVTHEVKSPERRSKVLRLMNYHQRTATSFKEWVQALVVREPGVETSAAAVKLVAALAARLPQHRGELLKARVLLLEDGELTACRRGQVFLPGPVPQPGKLIIDPVLAADRAVVEALGQLGIEVFDDAGELRNELERDHLEWSRIWASARRLGAEEAETIFREVFGHALLSQLRVRARDGSWRGAGGVFLPGEVIPGDGSRDDKFVVDARFHQQDMDLLGRLGLVDQPRRLKSPPLEPWRTAALMDARDEYRSRTGAPRLPDSSIDVDEGRVLWPLRSLAELSPEGRAALTKVALRQLDGSEQWEMTRAAGGRRVTWPDPVWNHLRRHGYLRTHVGLQPIARCIRWSEEAELNGVTQPLPFVDLSGATADALQLKGTIEDFDTEDWIALIDDARCWPDDDRFLLYAWAAYMGQDPPTTLKVCTGQGPVDVRPDEAAVTADRETYASMLTAGIPALVVPATDDARSLQERWGVAAGEDMLVESIEFDVTGEPFVVADRFPPLRQSVPDEQLAGLVAQPCRRIELLTATPTGQHSRALAQHLADQTVYVTGSTELDILQQIGRALDIHDLRPDVVLRRMEEQQRNQHRREIMSAPGVLEKLVLAIGADDLRRSIPTAALRGLEAKGEQLPPTELARLALAVDGYEILQSHRPSLERNGLEPPSRWAASSTARAWVRDLGFPIEFAGSASQSREAEIEVEGPPVLGELHDYQQAIAERIRGLLREDSEVTRGLVSLPTGAGKTRVAVQALVDHMAGAANDVRIVWVAETEELCEQATQTWSAVWRARGGPGVPMTLGRLWGQNEVEEREGHQVIVASIDKLHSVLKRDRRSTRDYGWLVKPTMIVVDEAHRSIGGQYTQTLSALGGTTRVAGMTTPMVGLTATPFRGFSEEETKRLVGRYQTNALDQGVFPSDDVYGCLQEKGILARVRQRRLDGAELTLSPEEEVAARTLRHVLPSVEERLGQNADRNAAIVDSVLELDPASKVLLFATSVDNARVLAALLTYKGVEARAVSGTTSKHARRRYIEDFQEGRVRVLTNYNVFTEGFDVPTVDAVFITRPTFSPNVYQQMIGRGLRGPLNGGKEEVLVVNVADNIANYGEDLAFYHFAHLWGGRRPEADGGA